MGMEVEDRRSQSTTAPPVDAAPASGATPSGPSLVAQATDPQTGLLDPHKLAGWVIGAKQEDPQAASRAQAEIESTLISQGRIGDLSRFSEDLRAAAQQPPATFGVPGMLAVGGQQALNTGSAMVSNGTARAASGTQMLVDNPILTKRWESTTSAWTQKGGFTEPLKTALRQQGIEIVPGVNAPPTGSVARGPVTTPAVANNTNGAAARDAIRQRYSAAGYDTRIEATDPGNTRRVDVRADRPNVDPRMAERVDIESKVGRAGANRFNLSEVARDGEALAANRAARSTGLALEEAGQGLTRTGRALETVGKVARPVALAMAAWEVGSSFRADGNRVGVNTGRSVSGLAGGGLGAWGGAAAGAAIGSVVPGVGTVIGGVVGGIIGGLAGDTAGRGLFDTVRSWF